jgi:hypothetical protein
MKPWETICTMPPDMPRTLPSTEVLLARMTKTMKNPRVTNPMWAIEE